MAGKTQNLVYRMSKLFIKVLFSISQVRGILNKLTPEKFDKLSDDLLQTELNSSVILKGVIILVRKKLNFKWTKWPPNIKTSNKQLQKIV